MNITVKIHNGHPICVGENGMFFVEETDEHERIYSDTLSAVVARLDKLEKAKIARPARAERKGGFYIAFDEIKEVVVTSVYVDETWSRLGKGNFMGRFTTKDREGKPERRNEKAADVYLDTLENRGILRKMEANFSKMRELRAERFELEKSLASFEAAAKKEEAADDGPALRIV